MFLLIASVYLHGIYSLNIVEIIKIFIYIQLVFKCKLKSQHATILPLGWAKFLS